MSESLFTVATILVAVLALLSQCASHLAAGVVGTVVAVAVPVLCVLIERTHR